MSARRPHWIAGARDALAQSLGAAAQTFLGANGSRAVHDARKELKRAASLSRGFGQMIGARAYVALEAANAARRAYGPARDLDVLPLALERVKCDPETRTVLNRAIAIARGAVPARIADSAAISAKLAAAAEAVAGWDLSVVDDEAFAMMLRQTYKAAKRRGTAAFATGDADDLHDLRTGVIDLWHQLEGLKPAWPALIEAQGEELRRLRQTLGDFNDLTLLGEFALLRRELQPSEAEAFVAAVQRRRKPLERKARAQFERVFAERPGAFARRLAAYMEHPQGMD